MKYWFLQLSRGKQITFLVVLAHFAWVLFLLVDFAFTKAPPLHHKVAVNTVELRKAPAIQPVAPTPQKKSVPKKAVSKPTAPPTKPNNEKLALLKKIENNLSSLTQEAPKAAKPAIQIPTLSVEAHETPLDAPSHDILAAFLQEALMLPEFGEVKALLSIDRGGHLVSLDILSSQSEKNAAFLKNRLPALQFPCLNEGASITVVFSNAM